jgi:hypothetical protein
MSEKLANVSMILLFGRAVDDIQLGGRGGGKTSSQGDSKSLRHKGASHFLTEQMAASDSCLARIYAFAYEGHYYELSKAVLFLVRGKGEDVTTSTVELTGVAASARRFAPDIKVWAYDKSDLSIRLDPETGTFEQILLEAELSADRNRLHYSGQSVRLQYSGQSVRLRNRGLGEGD